MFETLTKEKEKPENVSKYLEILYKDSKGNDINRFKKYYENVMLNVRNQFYSSNFWTELKKEWGNINQEYYAKTHFHLFAEEVTEVFIKPYDSMVDKTFRKNVVLNNNWPNEPEKGWIDPSYPFEKLNDLLRTTIIVKYLDGAEFVLKKIEELALKNNYNFRCDYEAKDKGYYAIHAYISPTFEIQNLFWDTENKKIQVEIQITTQIQDTIKKLTHEYYEKRRSKITNDELTWQWNYKSDEFALNYMGHILHYLEGMIMEIRDKKGDTNE